MALAHTLGFPRIGRDRELKKAQEAFWKGELDEAGLRAVGRQLRAAHWQVQKDAGIQLLPVGDFAWYDQVLTHSLTFGVIPERFRAHGEAGPTLHTLFGMARGVSDDSCCGGAHAQEMTKWFDTNYHYLVPEFSADQQFQLSWEQLFEEVDEARALGHQVKPVLIGPLTYLWLGKAKGAEFDRLDLLDRLLPLYGQIFRRLAGQGVEWVQIDEPILVLDLPQAWKNAFERAYNLLQSEPLKRLVATYFGGLEDNLGLAANLPVDGLHFPQTSSIRLARQSFKQGKLSEAEYIEAMHSEIRHAVEIQEQLGLDVLVHGEAERNDMVEYFAEQLDGYVFTRFGWVQSYGSRCVKPAVIYGDLSRPRAMTVEWIRYAQSLTDKVMKGMLTGPVTMLMWSFPREDVSREVQARQLALAIRDEVVDLEAAGIRIVQIDEAAFREGLPLRRNAWPHYLEWATEAFRLCASGVRDETQIHTHMCYSEFNDVIESIAAMDADVITIETSRSDMELLEAFEQFDYPNEIGPGVYDIHSPRVPSREEIVALLRKAARRIPAERLWVNPDCGLKTRAWPETEAALVNMVAAARELRGDLACG